MKVYLLANTPNTLNKIVSPNNIIVINLRTRSVKTLIWYKESKDKNDKELNKEVNRKINKQTYEWQKKLFWPPLFQFWNLFGSFGWNGISYKPEMNNTREGLERLQHQLKKKLQMLFCYVFKVYIHFP